MLLTLLAIAVVIKAQREEPRGQAVIRPSAPGERRILVIANETVGGAPLRDVIHRAEGVENRSRRLPRPDVTDALFRV